MVYSPNKVVACVKVDGRILREHENVVTLPFGSEYSVFIKNLNPTRIKVKVSVDGTDATEGAWLVVDANSDFELERFIRAANMDRGNRFKFIERTEEIEEHRGIKADDGLIRIEYQVEVVKPKPIIIEEHHHHHDHYDPWPHRPNPWRYSGTLGGRMKESGRGPLRAASMRPSASASKKSVVTPTSFRPTMDSYSVPCSATLNDQGITVPGSESDQKFRWTEGFETGASEVIVLQLRGEMAGKPVVKAVTVETKLRCVTCDTIHPSSQKFCSKCGTSLVII